MLQSAFSREHKCFIYDRFFLRFTKAELFTMCIAAFFCCSRCVGEIRCANKKCNSTQTMNRKFHSELFSLSRRAIKTFFRLANYSLNIEICCLPLRTLWKSSGFLSHINIVLLRRVHPVLEKNEIKHNSLTRVIEKYRSCLPLCSDREALRRSIKSSLRFRDAIFCA